MRAKRLRDLLEILPVPSDGLSFLGGEQSAIYFDEVSPCRSCPGAWCKSVALYAAPGG